MKTLFEEAKERITKEFDDRHIYGENMMACHMWCNGYIQGLIKTHELTISEVENLLQTVNTLHRKYDKSF